MTDKPEPIYDESGHIIGEASLLKREYKDMTSTHMLVPIDLVQRIANYLAKRPYEEVNVLIAQLVAAGQAHADQSVLPKQEEQK